MIFLPLCYLFLSSPFILAFIWYYGFDTKLLDAIGREKNAKEIALQLFLGLIAASLPTRILSGRSWDQNQHGGKRRVQQIPYWLPGVRHWTSIVLGGEEWLKSVRCVCRLHFHGSALTQATEIRCFRQSLRIILQGRSTTSFCPLRFWDSFSRIQLDLTRTILQNGTSYEMFSNYPLTRKLAFWICNRN
jgi:hypothetical protein